MLSVVFTGSVALFCSSAIDIYGYCTAVNVLAKSLKCRTKEVRRKGAEPEVTDLPQAACEVKTAATDRVLPEVVRLGTATAGGGRKDVKNKDKELLTYATKIFSGTGSMQSQSSGQLSICYHSIMWIVIVHDASIANFHFCFILLLFWIIAMPDFLTQ